MLKHADCKFACFTYQSDHEPTRKARPDKNSDFYSSWLIGIQFCKGLPTCFLTREKVTETIFQLLCEMQLYIYIYIYIYNLTQLSNMIIK